MRLSPDATSRSSAVTPSPPRKVSTTSNRSAKSAAGKSLASLSRTVPMRPEARRYPTRVQKQNGPRRNVGCEAVGARGRVIQDGQAGRIQARVGSMSALMTPGRRRWRWPLIANRAGCQPGGLAGWPSIAGLGQCPEPALLAGVSGDPSG